MILSIDVGTSMMKVGLFDLAGRLLEMAQEETRLQTDGGTYEIDPRVWYQALSDACGRLPGIRQTRAVVVSGNGPTIAPIDDSGRALHPAILWMDSRGQTEARRQFADLDVDTSFFLSKVLWFRLHREDIYREARWFVACPELVAAHLTGEYRTILPGPQYERYFWTDTAAHAMDLDPEKLPPYVGTGEVMGEIARGASAELGIPSGVPVVAAGPDFLMSLLGTATIDPGTTCDRAGTSEGVNTFSSRPLEDRRLLCLPHVVPRAYNVSGIISTTGKAVEWFRRTAGRETMDYGALHREVQSTPPGAAGLLFLPYLAGERSPHWDPSARGAFLGLSLSHDWKHMGRAVLEAIALAIRDVLEVMEEHGLVVETMRVAGTQARSAVLNQIKADVTGRQLMIPEVRESELMGDTCVGLAALGEYPDALAAARDCVRIETRFEPDRETRAIYDEHFGRYREAYRALKPLFGHIAGSDAGMGAL